jgi:serine/threonine protein kinase
MVGAVPDETHLLLGPRDPSQGDLIGGRYRLVRHVQRGGTGTVYRAEHIHVGRTVAVKVLRAALAGESRVAERFAREARIISNLEHPHTLKLFDFGWLDDGRPYLVTEFLEGVTLAEQLEAGPMPVGDAVRVAIAVLGSLAEAHDKGVVHRDLKPSNVFLQRTGGGERVRVLDFGIARHGASTTLTEPGMIMGTPAYMSPEQSLRDDIDGRSDLYSVGAILFEMLTGRPPFTAPNPQTLILKHALMPAPRLGDVVTGLPEPLEVVVAALLAKNPEQRPPHADAVIAMLRPFTERHVVAHRRPEADRVGTDWMPQLPDAGTRELDAPRRAAARSRVHRATVALAAMGVVLLSGAAALGFMRTLGRERPAPAPGPTSVAAHPEPLVSRPETPAPLANEYQGDETPAPAIEAALEPEVPARRPRVGPPPGYIDVRL